MSPRAVGPTKRVITATKGESNEALGNIGKNYGPALQGHEFPIEAAIGWYSSWLGVALIAGSGRGFEISESIKMFEKIVKHSKPR